ncbi:hypothetical protein [Streptomyces sp. NBC_00075]|uniref:hypothetical protein n=1 Tax=Streptomyces sp. NBC_00075 TaxID=2975641 RepID=UPI00386D9083
MHQLHRPSDRLLVRELAPDDVDAVHAIYGDPRATEHLSFDPRTGTRSSRSSPDLSRPLVLTSAMSTPWPSLSGPVGS